MSRDHVERAAARENVRPSYVQKLRDIAATIGLGLDYQGTRRVRGWPQKSQKPWHLHYSDGTLLCSFRTLEQLERNLRGRAGRCRAQRRVQASVLAAARSYGRSDRPRRNSAGKDLSS